MTEQQRMKYIVEFNKLSRRLTAFRFDRERGLFAEIMIVNTESVFPTIDDWDILMAGLYAATGRLRQTDTTLDAFLKWSCIRRASSRQKENEMCVRWDFEE